MTEAEKALYFAQQYNTRSDAALTQATLERWAQQGAQARRTMASLLNIYFEPQPTSGQASLDFFPSAQSGAPLLVFIHGGWWRFLDKSDFSWVAKSFVAAGFNVAVTNYDLCPAVSVRTIVSQQLQAVAYLHRHAKELGFDANRIHLAGHSAGAHLAAMMCAAHWPTYEADLPSRMFRSATLLSGLYELSPLTYLPQAQADLKLTTADLTALSPLSYVPSTVPSGVCAGGLESAEFLRQSELLRQHWGPTVQRWSADKLTHFTVVDDWASPAGALHTAALRLMHDHQV